MLHLSQRGLLTKRMTKMLSKSVLALGDVNPDIILPLASDKQSAELLRAGVSGGGTVANVASGLGRLSIPVSFCGRTGNDAFGHYMASILEKDGVELSHLAYDDACFTNMVFGVIEPDGERTIFVWPPEGAAQSRLSRDDLAFDKSTYSHLHISTINLREEPSADAILWCVESVKDSSITTTFDLNLRMEFFKDNTHFRDNLERAIKSSDIILGSAYDEIIPLTGINDPERAARSLAEDTTVIARLGKDGVLCVDKHKTTFIPAYEVEVMDTIGAGDAFDSGFIAALYEGATPHMAINWGNACAAISITRQDARSCPTRAELFAFLRTYHKGESLKEIFFA